MSLELQQIRRIVQIIQTVGDPNIQVNITSESQNALQTAAGKNTLAVAVKGNDEVAAMIEALLNTFNQIANSQEQPSTESENPDVIKRIQDVINQPTSNT